MPIQIYHERVAAGGAPGTPTLQSPRLPSLGGIARGVDELASTLGKIEDDQTETEALKAAAQTRMDIETDYRSAQDNAGPGADGFTPGFMKSYDERVKKTSDGLSSPQAQRKFQEKMLPFSVALQERALSWETGQRREERKRSFDGAIDNGANTLYTTDAANRDVTYQLSDQELKDSLAKVDLPPDVKADLADKAERKLGYAAVQGDIRDMPDKVQDWLVHPQGSGYYSKLRQEDNGAGYYSKLADVESGGKNVGSSTSTAFGPYQFTEGTWKDLITRHPDLGLTEKDRYIPAMQEIAIRAFTQDNAEVLKKAGFPATNANLYMTHLLGPQGGVDFLNGLKNDKDAPATKYVSQAAVDANGSLFLQGRRVKDVYAIFGQKFGVTKDAENKDGGAPSYYSNLTFEHRNQLYAQADAEVRRRRTEGQAAFKQTTDNVIAQYQQNGFSTDTVGEQQFIAAYGAARGTIEYGNFKAQAIAATATHDLQVLNINQHAQYLESIKPDESDPFYADKMKGYRLAQETSSKVINAIKEDAAGYATSYNKDLSKSLQTIDDLENSSPADRQAAVQSYLSKLGAEYARLGVPAGQRRTVPKAYADRISGLLEAKLQSDTGRMAAVGAMNQYAQAWGQAWPNVYADISDKMSPALKVMTSGIQPQAALALASVYKESAAELAKTVNIAGGWTSKDLDGYLQDEFQPYFDSTAFQPSSMPNVNDFYEQAKKLAIVYVRQGKSVSDAAEKAYTDLIGFKYRMVNDSRLNVRIPKPVDKGDVEAILRTERNNIIEKGDVQLGSQIPGAPVTADKQVERTRNWLGRNAKWVSLPDDSGVGLMVSDNNGRSFLWSNSKGKPITRSWNDLDALREKMTAGGRAQAATYPTYGWGP